MVINFILYATHDEDSQQMFVSLCTPNSSATLWTGLKWIMGNSPPALDLDSAAIDNILSVPG